MSTPNPSLYSPSQLNDNLDAHFSRNRTNDYDYIACLIIYWERADPGYKQEALNVQSFFTSKLNYPATLYEIPLMQDKRSHLAVDKEINRFMESLEGKHSLAIIHYGGHGDEDVTQDEDLREPRMSVWAASEYKNSPKVYWSEIQLKLAHFEGHVLLILDCCFAAQAARASDRVIPPNVELVAACAMRVKAPPPSRFSFTSKWLEEAEKKLKRDGHILISEMHDTLPVRNRGVLQTPQHWGLQGHHSTIRLDPLSESAPHLHPSDESAGSLSLHILTRSPLDNSLLDDILDWLKIHAPREIASVRVSDMTTLASHLRSFVLEDGACKASVAALHSLTQESQNEVRGTWDMFKINLASAATSLTAGFSVDWGSEGVADEIMVEEFLKNLERNVEALQRVVQRGVLSLPQLNTQDFLVSAIEDAALEHLNITDILRARLMACFPSLIPHTLETTPSYTQFQSKYDLAVPLLMEQHALYGSVLVEYKFYESSDTGSVAVCERRVERLAAVLQNAKPRTFHTPKCLGWFHEKSEARFALIFRPPRDDFCRLVSLRQILETHNPRPGLKTKTGKIRKPHLGERFTIARKVCKALVRWHSAGWLHQGIASHNIVFLQGADDTISYNEPFLCGFEFSRMHNELSRNMHLYKADVDVYKHPDRQGRPPNVRHTQDHDYYSLGLLLTEIGIWDYIPNFLDEYIEAKGPAAVQNKLMRHVRDYLRHFMGEAYEQATIICLESKLTQDGGGAGRMHDVVRKFEDRVLKALEVDPTAEDRKATW
jgi:hypothetical protein